MDVYYVEATVELFAWLFFIFFFSLKCFYSLLHQLGDWISLAYDRLQLEQTLNLYTSWYQVPIKYLLVL